MEDRRMSNDDSAGFFAPPAFKPAEALVQLRRSLRDLRGLSERGLRPYMRGLARKFCM